MSNRLEITMFGTFYSIGVLHLTQPMVKAGMAAYGPRKWHSLVCDIALGKESLKRMKEVSHTIGHAIKVVTRIEGIAMHGYGFGLEVFHCGRFVPIDLVEAEHRTLQPSQLMKGFSPKEVLAVFWAKREGAMFYRWEDVDTLKQEEVSLTYDRLAPLLAEKTPFDLALDVTWCGMKGRRTGRDSDEKFGLQKHVFHVAK